MQTIFYVPRLQSASVAAGACCPVPAEALIVPELEYLPGVEEAGADWQTGQVWVRHADNLQVQDLADVLADLGYPAESSRTEETRNTQASGGVRTVD